MSFFTIASFAQQTIEITRVKDAMSKGFQYGYAIDIPQASLEEAKMAANKQLGTLEKEKNTANKLHILLF